jgi:hypothetical protein
MNGSLETLRLCKMLDGVVRQMINRLLEDMKIRVERSLGIANCLWPG